jgi:hypothetical protein
MSYEKCNSYFQQKLSQWRDLNTQHSDVAFIRERRKEGLVSEFKNDSAFKNAVCSFLSQRAQKGNEKNTFSSIINENTEAMLQGDLLPAELSILISAVLEACAYSEDASGVLKLTIYTMLLGAGIGIGMGH